MDVHPAFFFLRLAIRRTGMIDPARIIAFIAAVDQLATVKTEEKGVIRILRVLPETFFCLLFRNALAPVFNETSPGRNLAGSEHAVAVNAGMPDLDQRFSSCGERGVGCVFHG